MDLACSINANAASGSTSLGRRLFIPDLAMAGAVLTLFLCLFLFNGTETLFRDSDSGWHIRVGERILATGIPRTDPFSFTRAGQPWFAWEWLSDVAMGVAHRAGGLQAVAVLYATVIALCTWLWFRLNWIVGGNFFFAAILASLMLSTANLHWLARPHVFGWALLLGVVIYAEKTGAEWQHLELAVLAIAGAVWANAHASFFLGSAVLWLYAVGDAAQAWFQDRTPQRARKLAVAGAILLAASTCNPYGLGLHSHLFSYLTNGELIERIGEFQSFNFHDKEATRVLAAVLVAALGSGACLWTGRIDRFLVTIAFVAIALRSARGLPILALICLPLANGAITHALLKLRLARESAASALDNFLAYSRNLRLIDSSAGGWAIAPLVVLLAAAIAVRLPAGFPAATFPVHAAAAVDKLPTDARLLAPDLFGGYLIYRFQGERKVFFDGRSDFYGAEFMKEYIDLVQVRPGWRALLEKHFFTHALLPNRYSLIPALEAIGWRRLYRDGVTTLLEKP